MEFTPEEAVELITQISICVGIVLASLYVIYRRSSPAESAPIKVGLTGGICSGKSTIRDIFATFEGVEVIDADKLGHSVYPMVLEELILAFGAGIVTSSEDGKSREVNRAKLGPLVFGDKTKMKQLQDIMWPKIRELIVTNMDAATARGCRVVVVEAAVMIEAKWTDLFDVVVVSTAPVAVAKQRLMTRNSLDEKAAMARIESQLTNEERSTHAQHIIVNDSDGQDILKEKATRVFTNILAGSK